MRQSIYTSHCQARGELLFLYCTRTKKERRVTKKGKNVEFVGSQDALHGKEPRASTVTDSHDKVRSPRGRKDHGKVMGLLSIGLLLRRGFSP